MIKEAEQEIIASARKFLIYYRSITPIVYTSVEDSGVMLTIRYLTEIRKRRAARRRSGNRSSPALAPRKKSIWLIPLTAW